MTMEALSESLALVGIIEPDAYAASSNELTDAIDMSLYQRVLFVVQVGTMGDTSTIDFEVQESATSDGTYAPIGGLGTETRRITQLAGDATPANSDSDKQVLVEVSVDDLTSGKRFIKGSLNVGTAASDVGVVAIGTRARYQPVSHLSSVAQILP